MKWQCKAQDSLVEIERWRDFADNTAYETEYLGWQAFEQNSHPVFYHEHNYRGNMMILGASFPFVGTHGTIFSM